MGNFGGSDALCAISTFDSKDQTIPLSCATGEIQTRTVADNTGKAIFDAGIIGASSKVSTVCTRSVIEDDKCSKFFNIENLERYLSKHCVGKSHCKIENLSSFVKTNEPGFDAKECAAPESQMFMQVACMVDDDYLVVREEQGLLIGCCAVFIALFVINYVDYIKKTQENNYVEWDVKTITAGDYAIEFDIEPKFFEDFIEKEYNSWVEKCAS